MQDFLIILGSALTGCFALLGVLIAGRQRRLEEQDKLLNLRKAESRRELVDLYANAITSFEQAIACVYERQPYQLTVERSLINSKIRLLGSELVNSALDDSSRKLEDWSKLHIAASPRRVKSGDQTMLLLQAPDPTEKFKVPAQEAFQTLQDSLQLFIHRMQSDLPLVSNKG